ncbi:hypothetical protein [Clostridium sporogenes]|nr:hypothetical protein [Clostridium sporogenes]
MNKNEISKEEYIEIKEMISKFFMDLDCSIKGLKIEMDKYITKKDTET